MSNSVLIVDDEPNILAGYRRQLAGKYKVTFAESGEQGLAKLGSHGPFAVVVSDMMMPGMNGVEFLKNVQTIASDSVRIMLTGSSIDTAIDAVNEGRIFRFLTKPCSAAALIQSLNAGIAQHELILSERTLLSNTLVGAVKILVDVLSAVRPVAFGRATRVRDTVRRIADELNLEEKWQAEVSALLSQVGTMVIPEATLRKAYRAGLLSAEESEAFRNHPSEGGKLVANVPRLKNVAEIIANQEKCFDGSGYPENGLSGEEIPLEARMLKVALDFDSMLQSGMSTNDGLHAIELEGSKYDKSVLDALRACMCPSDTDQALAAVGA
jgi:response regulator RpfG family c-di-GMP phosphodiesterase